MTGHPSFVEQPPLASLTDAQAPDFLESRDVTALLFHNPDLEPSRKMHDRVTVVAAKLQSEGAPIGFGAIDVRAHRAVAAALGIADAPTLVVFRGGSLVDRLMGTPPEAILLETLRARLPRSREPEKR